MGKAKEAINNGISSDIIINSMLDGVAVTDANGNFLQVNQATAKMHGFKSLKELIGKPFFELIAKEDLPKTFELIKKAFKTGSVSGELTGVKKDGSKVPLWISVSIQKDSKGKITGQFAVLRDMSEIKKTEQEIKDKLEELQKFHKASVGRELKMIELKKRIAELEAR